MTKDITTLPTTVINARERREEDEKTRTALRTAQAAYKALKDLPDIGEVPEAHLCTEEWGSSLFQAKKEAVNDVAYLSDEQKKAQIEHWRNKMREVYKYVRIIQAYVSSLPNGQYMWDASLNTFYLRNIDELIDQRCTYAVPTEAQDHWALVQRVNEAIAALRDWEAEHDTKRLTLQDLCTLDADTFAYVWAKNNMKVDHSFDHLPGVVVNREMTRKMIRL